MRKYFLTVVAIASSVIISCQQSQPSNTQVQQTTPTPPVVASAIPVPNTATKIKYVYPPEAISNYVDVCTKGGGTKKSCNCFISKAQDIYPLDKLIQINNDSSVGKPYPKDIDEILKSCQEKVAVTPEAKTLIPPPKKEESSGKILLEQYLTDITTGGSDGIKYFCESSKVYAARFFSPRSFTVLGIGPIERGFESYSVRIDSSNRGGSQITKTWDFYLKKEGTQGLCVYSVIESGEVLTYPGK